MNPAHVEFAFLATLAVFGSAMIFWIAAELAHMIGELCAYIETRLQARRLRLQRRLPNVSTRLMNSGLPTLPLSLDEISRMRRQFEKRRKYR